MDLKLQESQASCDAKIQNVMKIAEQKIISGITFINRKLADDYRLEITELERKLQDETTANAALNQRIIELTQENNLLEASLTLAEEAQERFQSTLNEKNSLIDHLCSELEVAQLNAVKNQERANEEALSSSTLNFFTPIGAVHVLTSQENNYYDHYEEGPQTSTVVVPLFQNGITRGVELEQYEYGNQEGEGQPEAPLLVYPDHFQQQQQQEYFNSYPDSVQERGDEEEEERCPKSPITEEEESNYNCEPELSPPPFEPWTVNVEAMSQQPLENFRPKPPTVLKNQQQQESVDARAGVEHNEEEMREEPRQLAETGIESRAVENNHKEPSGAENVQPLSPASPVSSLHGVNDAESVLQSPLESLAEMVNWCSSTPKSKNNIIDYDCTPEKNFSPRRMNNEECGSSSTSPYTRLLHEIQSSENRDSSKSTMPSSSNNFPEAMMDISDIDVNLPCQASRKRTITSSSSSSPSPYGTTKLRKQTEEPFPSTSNSSTPPENLSQQSHLYYRRNEYPANTLTVEGIENGSEGSVPEMHKMNYGFCNNYQLAHCPHARDFWYDSLHASSTKYLIRFYDDEYFSKEMMIHLTIKEQVGLAEPTVFQLKFEEIVQRLENNIKKPGGIRIWLDVRDWNIFSHKVAQFFHRFGVSITHFSFGRRLYCSDKVEAHLLLEFILTNLPNVEYLAFNDTLMEGLNSDFKFSPGVRDRSLHKLKTLRLISESFRFTTPFILAILLRAPVLSNVYGIPVQLICEMETFLKNSGQISPEVCMNSVKSVEVIRKLYSEWNPSYGNQAVTYPTHIWTLFRLCPSLEELDTRIFFIVTSETRKQCIGTLSDVLQRSALSLKKIRIELHGDEENLIFPRLEKCETLQMDMRLRPVSSHRYFPRGVELLDFFPILNTVEIVLEVTSKIQNTIQNNLKGKTASNLFDAHFSSDAFRSIETKKSVQRLNLVNFTPPDLMNKFQRLFPHITVLCLSQTLAVLSEVLPPCFLLWPKLKQLVLDVTFFSDATSNLDSVFTGIPPGSCRFLLEELEAENPQGQKQINTHPNKPAIYDLKELELLKIVLFPKGRIDSKTSGCLMTPVSAIYGFGKEKMPNLNVIIGFHEKLDSQERSDIIQHLEPMKPHVTIDE